MQRRAYCAFTAPARAHQLLRNLNSLEKLLLVGNQAWQKRWIDAPGENQIEYASAAHVFCKSSTMTYNGVSDAYRLCNLPIALRPCLQYDRAAYEH